jgi:hypothetical protein
MHSNRQNKWVRAPQARHRTPPKIRAAFPPLWECGGSAAAFEPHKSSANRAPQATNPPAAPSRKLGQHHLSSRAPRGICCLRPEGVFTREVGCLPKESPWAEHHENAATRQRAVSTVPHRSACCVSSYRGRARSACLSADFPPSLRPTPPSKFSISNRKCQELETMSKPYKTKAGDAV